MTNSSTNATLSGLPRATIILLTMAASMIVIAGIRSFAVSLGPIFLALIIIVIVSPVHDYLKNRGTPAWLSMLAMLVSAFGVLFVIIASLVWATIEMINLFRSEHYREPLQDAQDSVLDLLSRYGITGDSASEAVESLDISAIAGQITSAVSGLLGILSASLLLTLTMIFMTTDAPIFQHHLQRTKQTRPELVEALGQFAAKTRSYFVVSTVFGFIVAVLNVVVLITADIPLALVWGIVSLITNYVPNIGFVLGLVPPTLLAYFEGGWQLSLTIIIAYAILNFIVQSLIQPRFVGDAVGLSATLTFLSLIFWSWTIGPLGALLAVPMTLLAKALMIDNDPTSQWVLPLVSLPNKPDPAPAKRSSTGNKKV